VVDIKRDAELMLFKSIFNLLSFEKISFSGMYEHIPIARFVYLAAAEIVKITAGFWNISFS